MQTLQGPENSSRMVMLVTVYVGVLDPDADGKTRCNLCKVNGMMQSVQG